MKPLPNKDGWQVSLVDEVWTDYGPGNINDGALGLELQAGFTGQNGFTAVIGYGGQDTGEGTPNAELYNIWVSYETGALTLAAEYNDYENAGAAGNSGDSLMGLARYALNEKSSITGRYSEENLNDGRATENGQSPQPILSPTTLLVGSNTVARSILV